MAQSKKERFYQRPGFRVGLILSSIVIFLILTVLGCLYAKKSLFERNANFTIKRVVVRSGGWWEKHKSEVLRILGVTPGVSNLFACDLPSLRKKLEKQPSIESVEVSRIIPDTLLVDINERIPYAFLHWRGNTKVVDSNCMVMSTSSCVNVGRDLPVVTGFTSKKEDLIPGAKLSQATPAIKLIDEASKLAPAIRFERISLNSPDYFKTYISVSPSGRHFTLYLSRKNVDVKLAALAKLLPRLVSKSSKTKIIDMRYKGQAVVK